MIVFSISFSFVCFSFSSISSALTSHYPSYMVNKAVSQSPILTFFFFRCTLCFCFLLLFLFYFPFIFISWRLITLQYCSGFCHTLTWISHGFTCVPHPNPPSCHPPHPRIPHQRKKWFRVILIPNCKKSWWRTLFGPMESGSYYWKYNWPKKHTAYKNRSALLLTVLFSVVLKKTGVFPEARKEFMIRTNNSKNTPLFSSDLFSPFEIISTTSKPWYLPQTQLTNYGQLCNSTTENVFLKFFTLIFFILLCHWRQHNHSLTEWISASWYFSDIVHTCSVMSNSLRFCGL